MREILFKAKRINNGEWVEGYCAESKGKTFIGIDISISIDMFEVFCTPVIRWLEIDPKTLCQFKGLYDKNGKKIWENDIVEAWSQGSRAIGTVKQRVDGLWIMSPAWQNHEFWELKPNSNGETTVEVLVNAFDNPELLQEEQ